MKNFVDEKSSIREINKALDGRLSLIAIAAGSGHQFRVSRVRRKKGGNLEGYNPSSGWHLIARLWTTA